MKNPKKIFVLLSLLFFTFIITSNLQAEIPSSFKPKIQAFEPYTFIAYGDSRNSPEGDNSGMEASAQIIKSVMEQQEISFILHGGDVVNSGGSPDEYDEYWKPTMGDILEEVPFYVAPGNHEYSTLESGPTDIELVNFRNNVVNPNNSGQDETYFSFDSPLGDTHFIFLNTEYYFGILGVNGYNETRQEEQIAWLKTDLSENTAARTVVVFHRPIWGASLARVPDYRLLRAELHDILTVNYSVDLVVQGHDHHFYHTVRNDTDFMVIGAATPSISIPTPSGGLEEWQEGDYSFGNGINFAITVVTATEAGFEVLLLDNGSTIYEFSIDAPVDDVYDPLISSPADLSFVEGATGQTITWTVNDINTGTYSISVDGVEDDSGSWTQGESIVYDVSAFTVGTYEVEIEATDANTNSATDKVTVTVTSEVTTTTGTAPGLELLAGLVSLIAGVYIFSKKRRN